MADKNDSGSEEVVSSEEEGPYVPDLQAKPPPPPPKIKGPKTPAQELGGKVKLAIHKIGGAVMEKEAMEKLWCFEGDEKYAEVLEQKEIQDLISDKLRHCAALGNITSLEFLGSKGGDINAVDEFTGNTPLMIATGVRKDFEKSKNVITYLMENGADCNVKNKYGLTPKSAIPGFADSPLVVYVREMDLKMKDKKKLEKLPAPKE